MNYVSKKDYLKYIGSLLLFGSNGFVASFIALSSHEIVLLRSVLGAALLAVLFFLTGHRTGVFIKNKRDTLFVILSGIAMAADWLFLFEAYQQIGVSLSILINYCGPFIVIALSPLVLKEKIHLHKVIALIIAFVGVVLISGSAVAGGINPKGLICAALSAFAYACMVLANKKNNTIIGMENAMLQLFTTMIVVAFFSSITHRIPVAIESSSIFPVLWLGLINTGLGCFLYFSSISTISAQSVGILGYLEPLSGVVLSVAFLGEKLTFLQIIGGICILAGALYSERKLKKHSS